MTDITKYTTSVREGETLLTALYREGRYLQAACGGHGRCRRCRVQVVSGPVAEPNIDDTVMLSLAETVSDWRLACKLLAEGEYTVKPAFPVGIDPVVLPDTPATGRRLGLAVDLGTTTVGAALVDLDSDEVLGERSRLNSQVAYGEDVLSRLRYGFMEEHLERLSDLARYGVDTLLAELLIDTGLSPADLESITLVGNASMTMLFLEWDPADLATPPYEPELAEEGVISVDSDAFLIDGEFDARFLPALGGHVGSDTTAAVLASDLLDGVLPALLIDLGTNGEVVLATEHAVLATSSAAGPAFEGGAIGKGSPAQPGAVEHVDVEDGKIVMTTIGGEPPVSWCGSGVLEITAALLETGDLDASGRMVGDPRLPVDFTQSDVREVQLAKGAVAAAVRTLCREAGVLLPEIRRVVLTGAFGSNLRVDPARRIGLIPASAATVEVIANGALAGAARALDAEGIELAEKTAARIRHVPLGDRADFQETFVSCMVLEELTA